MHFSTDTKNQNLFVNKLPLLLNARESVLSNGISLSDHHWKTNFENFAVNLN